MSFLERQRASAKRRQSRSSSPAVSTPASRVDDFQDLVATAGWPGLTDYEIPTSEFSTNSLLPKANSGGEILNRRKAKNKNEVKCEGGKSRDKRIKLNCEEDEESKITEQTEISKRNSKTSVQKSDYVHVRARRGQATDSHSLAERARREKISERMKYLQNLVPGCNKIAGKAGMLDEIINYVQSLQQQVEFLSMKLATVNPRLDFSNVDDVFSKQVLPTIEISRETVNSSSFFNQLEIGSSLQTPLMNTASSIAHFELCSTWGGNLQSLYMNIEQGGPPLLSPSSFSSQQYSAIEDDNETLVVPF